LIDHLSLLLFGQPAYAATFHSKNAGSEVSAEAPHPVPGIRHQNKGITYSARKVVCQKERCSLWKPLPQGFFGFFLSWINKKQI